MPRRPPPTSLRLVKGPLPARGHAKHTLPSVPRPVLDASDLARVVTVSIPRVPEPRTHAGHNTVTTNMSSFSTMHASSSSEITLTRSSSLNNRTRQPSRRTVSRDLDSSGLLIPSPPSYSSTSISASRSSSSLPLVGFGGGVGMGSSGTGNTSPSSSSLYSSSSSPSRSNSGSPALVRGPWDHSRAVSIDVDSMLAMPKPVVVT
ncbi:hypothetical protein PNOK_0143800 [Pyrrhoderma noxium]|uniref:Uncharacterized protein n=1 Tax=Pyrrhoderma noxium TaxID=2282107 RepID=A0A286UXP5_9AGAM|nr:hypothetical protein PNOK_0143800 [Pyrrhoderma noxium]